MWPGAEARSWPVGGCFPSNGRGYGTGRPQKVQPRTHGRQAAAVVSSRELEVDASGRPLVIPPPGVDEPDRLVGSRLGKLLGALERSVRATHPRSDTD